MRLQQPIQVDKPVASIRLRIEAEDIPDSAAVLVTDVQLQPGETATGVTLNVEEARTELGRFQYRNGVVNPGLAVVALSNADEATPARLGLVATRASVRAGAFRFGKVNGRASVDAEDHSATQGWGLGPVVTARQDLNLLMDVDDRAHVRLSWRERS